MQGTMACCQFVHLGKLAVYSQPSLPYCLSYSPLESDIHVNNVCVSPLPKISVKLESLLTWDPQSSSPEIISLEIQKLGPHPRPDESQSVESS